MSEIDKVYASEEEIFSEEIAEEKAAEDSSSGGKKKKRKVSPRGAFWQFIFYPESTSLDFVINTLSSRSVAFIVSPLHSEDKFYKKVNGKLVFTGKYKKPHYHVIVYFGVSYRESSAIYFCEDCAVNNKVYKVASPRAAYRYLAHLDNPEKAQYNIDDCINFGFPDRFLSGDRDQNLITVTSLIYEGQITSYSSLVHFLLVNNYTELLKDVVSRSYFYNKLIESYSFDLKNHVNYDRDAEFYEGTKNPALGQLV